MEIANYARHILYRKCIFYALPTCDLKYFNFLQIYLQSNLKKIRKSFSQDIFSFFKNGQKKCPKSENGKKSLKKQRFTA
jgi:hypothetical protein